MKKMALVRYSGRGRASEALGVGDFFRWWFPEKAALVLVGTGGLGGLRRTSIRIFRRSYFSTNGSNGGRDS